jgi:hypothetical protein
MNIHHLELFYFVAKHVGIAAAVRNIPYGIQQPAVSGQIAKLEESLGTKLFQRRPFALSPTGTELFEFIRPFFENIDVVAERLRQNNRRNCASRLPRSCCTITCRKSCNVFAENSRRSGFICTRRLALMPNDCFCLAMSTSRSC